MKLFVGNLPFEITSADLMNFFGQLGQVTSARVITDPETGRSRGFGFVDMPQTAAAELAIAEFNGADALGRTLVVRVAEPVRPRSESRTTNSTMSIVF
jgi:RNA recognition motif-containing protein